MNATGCRCREHYLACEIHRPQRRAPGERLGPTPDDHELRIAIRARRELATKVQQLHDLMHVGQDQIGRKSCRCPLGDSLMAVAIAAADLEREGCATEAFLMESAAAATGHDDAVRVAKAIQRQIRARGGQ